MLPKLFETFAKRYAKRPGGYTRIHRIDNRAGDNAPMALLELVDNPRDFKLEMTARAIGRDLLTDKLRWDSPRRVLNSGVDASESIVREAKFGSRDKGELRPSTRRNLQKVLKYRGNSALKEIGKKAGSWIVSASTNLQTVGSTCFVGNASCHADAAEESTDGSGCQCECQKQDIYVQLLV